MKQSEEGAQKVMMEGGSCRKMALFIINGWKRECAALRLCKRGALHNRESSSLFYPPLPPLQLVLVVGGQKGKKTIMGQMMDGSKEPLR